MALSPIVKATLQSAVLGGVANFLAQFFRSYRTDVRMIPEMSLPPRARTCFAQRQFGQGPVRTPS